MYDENKLSPSRCMRTSLMESLELDCLDCSEVTEAEVGSDFDALYIRLYVELD